MICNRLIITLLKCFQKCKANGGDGADSAEVHVLARGEKRRLVLAYVMARVEGFQIQGFTVQIAFLPRHLST